MASTVALGLFVVAFGFVTAALIASIAKWAFADNGKIPISFSQPHNVAFGLLFFMMSGPYLVFSNGANLWKEGEASGSFFGMCCLTAILWSFCLGILIIQALSIGGVLTPQDY